MMYLTLYLLVTLVSFTIAIITRRRSYFTGPLQAFFSCLVWPMLVIALMAILYTEYGIDDRIDRWWRGEK